MSTSREDRIFYQSLGICPRCKRNRILGDEKNCPECRAKNAETQARHRERNRDRHNANENASHMMRYFRLKEQGLCPKCGRKPMPGRVHCRNCADKLLDLKHRSLEVAI